MKTTFKPFSCSIIALMFLSLVMPNGFAHAAVITVKAQYRPGSPASNTQNIQSYLNLVNTSASAIPLSELTVRYWYTVDGEIAQQFSCDYAPPISCANLTGTIVKLSSPSTSADYYLQLGFTTGSLDANGQTGEIQTRVNKTDWTNYTQTNDYSFNAAATIGMDSSTITVYRNGVLIWGTEPGGSAPTATAIVTSTPTVTSTVTATQTSAGTATITVTPTATSIVTVTRTPTIVTAPPLGCDTTDIALNKLATSSSNENTNTTANLAVDGNAGTRWSSAFSDPQWIQVDLGAVQSICRVKLTWEAAYGSSYQVQTSSDAANWSVIYSSSTGDGGSDDLTGLVGSGRYIRIYGTVRATAYGYSLWGFEVYSGSSNNAPGLDPHQVVNTYGQLQIAGTALRDQNGNAIQLAGMSSHGLTWFPLSDLNLNQPSNISLMNQAITFNPTAGVPFPYTSSAVGNLVNQWHIQVIRASMFTYDPWNGPNAMSYSNNYPTWKWYNINLVNSIVQSAIDQNIYVIIDWHAGEGDDPNPYPYWANGHVQEFFTYMVDKWGSYPNVIYETVNSPNCISWADNGGPGLKTFNQNVINLIRAREAANGYAPKMILAGTPTWSQDVDVVTNDPLTGNLIAYNFMWYAGTHGASMRAKADAALANLSVRAPNQTLFMGEVGTSQSNGAGGVYYAEFNTWMEWAKTRKLSWLNWSIASKQETSAIFVPAIMGNVPNNEIAWRGGNGVIPQALASTGSPMRIGPWTDADYSCSGKFIKGWMLNNTSQPVPAGC